MNITFDTYAWIEYLEGSAEGKEIRKYLESPSGGLFTPSIVLAELSDAIFRGKIRVECSDLFRFIKINTTIVDISEDIAKMAGTIKSEIRKKHPGIGLIDAIVLSTARVCNSNLLTGDPHLISESDVINIRKIAGKEN